ncbi:protein NRT1/ PTR FAMILY 5.2-like [Nymphaea colorata]|nr:protein NRT1/ PTR FAMILY 5.2-like [Nymphaea colorata]
MEHQEGRQQGGVPAIADGGGFTQDGSVDLKGRPVLRSQRGGWRACSFIVGYEVFERWAYHGISSNLILYLTTQLHQGTVTASNNVTTWVGTVWMTPILGAYVADAFLGRYWTFAIASIIYLSGMSLLTLAVSISPLKPPSCHDHASNCKHATPLQVGVFFLALYIVALGTGGTKPNISTMGADQFDDFEPRERKQKLSFFNWWMFSIFFGTLFANTFLIYIQDNVGWSLGYGLPTVGLALSILVFLIGTPFYRHKRPAGSPFAKMAMVLVAAARKWKEPLPRDPKELHELDDGEYARRGKFTMESTSSLGFLNKAAVRNGPTTRWRLCPVTQVEETKQMLKMIPIFFASFFPSTVIAQSHTLFIKQGITLDRSMGPHFKIPPASLTAFVTLSMLISLIVYDRWLVPKVRKYTKNPRGITLLQRMGIGLVMQTIILVIACSVERIRLSYVKHYGLQSSKEAIPLTIFILLPQFALMGLADAFVEVAKIEFFYDQAPETMKSLGASYFTSSIGVGNFFSSFLLRAVSEVTENNGHGGWVRNNLNVSRLDYYYGLLVVLSVVNFIYFLIVSKHYVYRVEAVGIDVALDKSSEMKIIKASALEGAVGDVEQ